MTSVIPSSTESGKRETWMSSDQLEFRKNNQEDDEEVKMEEAMILN